jgi:hypothetical protein
MRVAARGHEAHNAGHKTDLHDHYKEQIKES